uniref:hypothetical protein n=1 Tax=Hassallia byssoidea TaxID=482630 RepID=UPI001F226715|nr:hypothetical protein [Hassalia byssoidea]
MGNGEWGVGNRKKLSPSPYSLLPPPYSLLPTPHSPLPHNQGTSIGIKAFSGK